MVGVFGIFAILPLLDLKEMGIGLALAILIDATIIRAVLLPASMMLLGDWNWYLPKWLEWLPNLEHERSVEPVAPPRPRRLSSRLPDPDPASSQRAPPAASLAAGGTPTTIPSRWIP